MNDYDKAARYAAKLDPIGFLRWLAPGMAPDLVFREWLDTRTLPFPGEADRTCDTVAGLSLAANPQSQCVMVVEFQSEPQREMLDRLLEYASRLNRELNQHVSARRRITVVSGLVNLTGRRQPSRLLMELPGDSSVSLGIQPAVRTLSEEDAAATLAAIDAGTLHRCILVWIPLMRGGGQRSIIKEWMRLASAEPDRQLRTAYSGLALVFAALVNRASAWRTGLEGWNVRESPIANEWRAEGRLEIMRRNLLELFELRFGRPAPAPFTDAVASETDLERLDRWFRAIATASAAEEFLSGIELQSVG